MSNTRQSTRRWLELDGLYRDTRHAIVGLIADRTFSLAAIATLAIAIGLNVTVFAVMDAILSRGFPLVNNDRLVYMQEHYPTGLCCMTYPDFEAWRSQAQAFEDMAFVAERPIVFSEAPGRSIDLAPATMTTNAFRLLGVRPMLGRDFTPDDEAPGAPRVVILAHYFWESRFNKRADIIGLPVQVNGAAATIVGVMPDRFDFPIRKELWLPLLHTPELQERTLAGAFKDPGGYLAFGRLRRGVTVEQARAELEGINHRLEELYPETNRGVRPSVDNHSQFFVGADGAVIYRTVWAAAWLLLLSACANLANLALARTIGRSRELSIRLALGSGRWRIARQILIESLLLAAVGGALGWWITTWAVHTWAVATESQYRILDYTVHLNTLVYLVGVSLTAAILMSIPALGHGLQPAAIGQSAINVRGATAGGRRLARALVVAQMVLAIVLLSGAGILVRSLMTVVNADAGVRDPQQILVGSIRLPSDKYRGADARLRFAERLRAQLQGVAGIVDQTMASNIPVNFGVLRTFEIEGRADAQNAAPSAQFLWVGPEYFRIVGAAVVAGREFDGRDIATSPPVAIVNESFVRTYWPGEQATGKRLRSLDRHVPGPWRTVVGVVPNIMQGDPTRQRFKPLVYVPFRQEPPGRAFFLARTSVPPERIAPTVRSSVQQLEPDSVLEDFMTMKASFGFRADRMDREHSEMGKHAAVAPILALTALLLASIGLYAVVAHSIGQRTREIGIRMALGATADNVRRMVLRTGMLPALVGMTIGLAGAVGVNRILHSQLVGVSPFDPPTLVGALAILVAIAWLACTIPARRALQVNPAVALRHD